MASSSSNQVPRIPDLFSWNPPRLSLRERPVGPGVKLATSRKTHEPAFLDRHFSEKLKLFHVKRLPTLVSDLTSVVDKSLANSIQLPVSHFHSTDSILDTVSEIEKNMVDEREVASFYERTTASFSLRVASVLALGVRRLLRWSQSANVSGYAIADGFLYFPDPTDAESAVLYAQLEAKLGKETVDLIRLPGKDRSSLATYEFKNLAAGRGEVLLELPKLSNLPKFPWTDCTAPDCATLSKQEVERGKVKGMEWMIGHDAKSPPWTLDSSIHVRGSSETKKRKRDNDCDNQNSANPSPAPEPSYDQGNLPVHRRSSRLFMPPAHIGGVELGAAFPSVKGKEKEVAEGTGEVQSNEADDASYEDENGLSAVCIVQQAWAQAARTNCSIIVIQSGNYEYIGIRHRATQTLYISDLIQPYACRNPSYGKLHVGLYIAAVQEVIDRAKQDTARSGDDPNDGGPSDGIDHKDEGSSKGPRGGDLRGGEKGGKPTEGEGSDGNMVMGVHEIAATRTLEFASRRDVVLVYLQYDIYDSPSPSTFVRSGPNGHAPDPLPSRETVQKYRLEECLTIVLKSEIGDGQTGKVLRGMLMIEASAVLLDIALKLALGSERGNALRNEYRIYRLLGKSGVTAGITAPLGLFDDVQGDACALVMPYMGSPLADMPEFVLTNSYQEAILATLKEMHTADILHGDLRLDNVLVADSGHHTLIDFGRSRVCCDQDAKDHEYSRFEALLVRRAKRNRKSRVL